MKRDKAVMAWHFTNGGRLRDGRPVPPVGEWLVHEAPAVLCVSGLHASKRLRDALGFAPGMELHRVECAEIVTSDVVKFVCRRRRIVATLPAAQTEHVLWLFARVCALLVVDKWDAPEIVTRYLWSGDESIRDAACDAARAAARDAAWAAAWAAARAAACDAAWDAARAAAWDGCEQLVLKRMGL